MNILIKFFIYTSCNIIIVVAARNVVVVLFLNFPRSVPLLGNRVILDVTELSKQLVESGLFLGQLSLPVSVSVDVRDA